MNLKSSVHGFVFLLMRVVHFLPQTIWNPAAVKLQRNTVYPTLAS